MSDAPETGPASPPDDFRPVVKWLPPSPPDGKVLVCIDFGTSFSKAWASKGDDPDEVPELIDMALSPDADGSARHLMPSELLIHEGEVLFGRAARKLFDDMSAEQERLIDNPKQYMTSRKNVSKIGKRVLPEAKNPGGTFTERDALVLYLSHLARMVDQALASAGLPQSLFVRYTHPAWKKKIARRNSILMRRIVAEAIALARRYPSDFEERLGVGRASRLLSAARQAPDGDLPFGILKDAVLEATAAGAGALMEAESNGRKRFVILDIGAGTTDVAGFICIRNEDQQRAKVWEISDARGARKRAGNAMDKALRRFIMERSSLAKGSMEYSRADRVLRRTIRAEKEALFSIGKVLVELITDELVEVSLEDFRRDSKVEKIYALIKDMVSSAAFAIKGRDFKVHLVPTGGGARLSLIEELVSKPLVAGDRRVKLVLSDAMPEQLKEAYPGIEPYYPQLAVAIGGTHPALPEQKPTLGHFPGDPGRKYLRPMYTS